MPKLLPLKGSLCYSFPQLSHGGHHRQRQAPRHDVTRSPSTGHRRAKAGKRPGFPPLLSGLRTAPPPPSPPAPLPAQEPSQEGTESPERPTPPQAQSNAGRRPRRSAAGRPRAPSRYPPHSTHPTNATSAAPRGQPCSLPTAPAPQAPLPLAHPAARNQVTRDLPGNPPARPLKRSATLPTPSPPRTT